MPSLDDDLLDRLRKKEQAIQTAFDRLRGRWRYRVEAGRVRFDHEVHLAHTRLKKTIPRYLGESSIWSLVTAPVIYSLIVPITLLDLWVTIYQAICFRAYGMPRVRRSAFIVVDRQHLAYLNIIEKLNCVYCSYGNGVIAYVREVVGQTELYWCPIRHARRVHGPHGQYRHFVDYGDAQGYRRRIVSLRKDHQATLASKVRKSSS